MKADLYEFEATIRRETEEALLLFDGEIEVWLPKVYVEDNGDGTFTIPSWLAVDKGLV